MFEILEKALKVHPKLLGEQIDMVYRENGKNSPVIIRLVSRIQKKKITQNYLLDSGSLE